MNEIRIPSSSLQLDLAQITTDRPGFIPPNSELKLFRKLQGMYEQHCRGGKQTKSSSQRMSPERRQVRGRTLNKNN
ncbi:MAG: hypothetical protein M3P33_01320 [bacterium]|nr:hypothetical protein [bacterium]